MTREEALKIIKKRFDKWALDDSDLEALKSLIPELVENDDERIRNELIEYLTHRAEITGFIDEEKDCKKWIAYLEKQKEPIPIPNKFSGLKSLMLQYLQSAANRKDDAEIEDDTDLYGRKILDYIWKYDGTQKEQQSDGKAMLHVAEKSYQIGLRDGKMEQNAEPFSCGHENGSSEKPNNQWSDEDEEMRNECVIALSNWRDAVLNYGHEVAPCQRLIDWLKSLRPSWKPSKEQMAALKEYVEEARGTHNASMGGYTPYLNLQSLYNDLKSYSHD